MSTLEDVGSGVVLSRYIVQSSDVLSDMKVNVKDEGSDNVRWYKERFLAEDEIIEHVVDNASSIILWTIHRPKRGWYIRIRAPTFPPGVFIPLAGVPKSSPYHTDAALTFACRTGAPSRLSIGTNPSACSSKQSVDSDVTLTDRDREGQKEHSYPPTPSASSPTIRTVSLQGIESRLRELPQSSTPNRRPHSLVTGSLTHFLITPHSTVHVPAHAESTSFFTRLVSSLKSHSPAPSYSFTISPISSPLPPNAPESAHIPITTPVPILAFHDQTPVWTARSMTGLVELNNALVRSLGVEPSFYIACALTYLEFLSEREGFLAASAD
ncbi:hypothetical protein QCA50_016083 [Cerrena zonata]|uniref:Uncharacterized protein n=1 Tax=Cerrena zonata TaxID=2478898 RepID=A0AAW0FGW0_9APHY